MSSEHSCAASTLLKCCVRPQGEAVNTPPDFKLNLGKSQFDCNGAIGGSSGALAGC